MKFIIKNNRDNPLTLMRRIGYAPHSKSQSFVRRLTSEDFPRFHVYMGDTGNGWEVSLHLDQRGACYDNQTAHSGDYEGKILEEEKQRIIVQLSN